MRASEKRQSATFEVTNCVKKSIEIGRVETTQRKTNMNRKFGEENPSQKWNNTASKTSCADLPCRLPPLSSPTLANPTRFLEVIRFLRKLTVHD
ncbi:hypothetical protein Y032_0291g1574 [Ancylostoma ceylanicum]|uniref:Uncharacterized protein n=1 Tax=Ancylostoma ceylanicum TaxID=53326 RepID=A0A016S5L7_9BILA|nr:hypothetical protein Y032_0291g1574 [Ancylostoma ceylanicum]